MKGTVWKGIQNWEYKTRIKIMNWHFKHNGIKTIWIIYFVYENSIKLFER